MARSSTHALLASAGLAHEPYLPIVNRTPLLSAKAMGAVLGSSIAACKVSSTHARDVDELTGIGADNQPPVALVTKKKGTVGKARLK